MTEKANNLSMFTVDPGSEFMKGYLLYILGLDLAPSSKQEEAGWTTAATVHGLEDVRRTTNALVKRGLLTVKRS